MRNVFTEHPHSVGESYFQHLFFASQFGFRMVIGGLACLTHAVFPFVFKKTGSNYLLRMTDDFICRMPVVEERVVLLARSIETKRCQTDAHYQASTQSVPNNQHVH
jgi:hypothetical protein